MEYGELFLSVNLTKYLSGATCAEVTKTVARRTSVIMMFFMNKIFAKLKNSRPDYKIR